MANKYNNKIILSTGEVLIDLTQDDVNEELVAKGIKFHDKSGAQKVGTSTKTVDASNVPQRRQRFLTVKHSEKEARLP